MQARHIRHLRTAAALLAVAPLAIAAPAHAASCDRTCLSHAVDTYLNALYNHDPAEAGLAADYKGTENAAATPAGDGLWKTATGAGPLQRRFLDPTNEQAAVFGTLDEGGATDIVSLRLKVAGRKVTEAEWTVARPGPGMFSIPGLVGSPPPQGPLAKSDRMSRAKLVALTDAYFQAIQQHDGSSLPHEAGCDRIENGNKVTNRVGMPPPLPGAPAGGPPPAAGAGGGPGAAAEMRSGDCVSGFDRFAHSIASVDARRYPVVDEQQGVVLGEVLFHRPAGSPMKRNLLNEYFWLKDGKIAGMYAAMYYLPKDAPDTTGWE